LASALPHKYYILAFYSKVNQTTIKHQTATIDQLKKQIQGKVELESNFDECVEELGRVQCEEEVRLTFHDSSVLYKY
jgi:hypothetical protein